MVEASRRERFFLYGAVPIMAAVLGAVTTVVIGRLFGGDHPADVMLAIVKDHQLSPADKAKLMALANDSTQRFYSFVSTAMGIMGVLIGAAAPNILPALADRIRRK